MDTTSEQPVIEDDRITTFGRLIETHALLTHSLDNELRQAVGIPLLWFGVLLHVARSPNQIRPISELVAATAFTNGGVTRLVDRMEAAGLVERLPCPSDRRVHWVGLTEQGRDLLQRGAEVHLQGIQRRIVDVLDADERASLDAILVKLLGTADACR